MIKKAIKKRIDADQQCGCGFCWIDFGCDGLTPPFRSSATALPTPAPTREEPPAETRGRDSIAIKKQVPNFHSTPAGVL
jgi:hypothetical protein